MKLAIRGREGPLASQTREEAIRRGHQLSKDHSDAVIYLPHAQAGSLAELEQMVAGGGFRKLVLRSHAMVYGANPKNPGFLTEDRVSLLPERAPESRWLRAEQIAARFGNAAIVRLTNVLAPKEGDLIVKQLAGPAPMPLPRR